MNPSIVYLEADSLRAHIRRPNFPHTWTQFAQTPADKVAKRLIDADIAIINKARLDVGVLAQLPKLRLIALAATGADNVDLAACRARGIAVANIRGYAVNTVPEHVFMLLLALSRRLLDYRADIANGRWQEAPGFCFFDHPIRDLAGATLGIIGRGALGEGVALRAAAFGMKILWAEKKGAQACRAGFTPFDEVLAHSDAVSLHCPLNDDTRNLLGAEELAQLKDGALLINTARGGLVDEAALAQELLRGRIAAGFDVLSTEPPRAGNPLLAASVLALPNFILTPHVAWASSAAMQRLADQLIDTIEAWQRGERMNRLD